MEKLSWPEIVYFWQSFEYPAPPLVKIIVELLQINTERLEEFLEAGELALVGGDEVNWVELTRHDIKYTSFDTIYADS